MNSLEPFELAPQELEALRRELSRGSELVRFADCPGLAALVASLGIQREIGTGNDELGRFLFDAESGTVIPRENLKAQLVRYGKTVGVRIWAEGFSKLELRFPGMLPLLHPKFSFRTNDLAALVIFPESLAKILALENLDAVIVRPWALNTVFGGFDPAKHYYSTNFWELENNDTVRFASLVENRRVALLGTHDVVAHVAGGRGETWGELGIRALRVRNILEDYFATIRTPTITSLVLPYTIGVLLDDLAQPPNYESLGQRLFIDELLQSIERRVVPPGETRVLMRFPTQYEKIINFAREGSEKDLHSEVKQYVRRLVGEIMSGSVVV